ncbi:MAG: hypothetical protein PHG82_05285 [Candidatus Gracilibacteria bacterium]|nr:hypothetical protein [Candidatus Gracilibacteria bacterium]
MYLDRSDMAFRENEKCCLDEDNIVVYRPGNRMYPETRGYKDGEVIKARVIDKVGDDSKGLPPVFSDEVKLIKIQTVEILDLDSLENKEHVLSKLKTNYPKRDDFSLLTQINMQALNTSNLIDNSSEIRELFNSGIMKFAQLPENNTKNIDELLNADNFSLTFINHDYAGITPKMWNYIASEYSLDIKNSMVIIKRENLAEILKVLKLNNKYIGGGFGVGFKDTGWDLLNREEGYFVNPIADEMQSTNFVAHFGDEIHGYNSDATGYSESLTDKFKEIGEDITDKTILLLGAGGTARGIALELVNRGIKKLIILNRTVSKASDIADKLNVIKPGICEVGDENSVSSIDYKLDAIINLSTKGADGDFEKLSGLAPASLGEEGNIFMTNNLLDKFSSLNSKLIVSDINLTKTGTTPLLDIASEKNLETLDGKFMVVYQGTEAIWTVFGDKIIAKGGTKEDVKKKLLKFILNK